MSIDIMNWVWKNSTTKGSERLVLISLADQANDAGVCWPSLNTIAIRCNLDRRYVIEIIKKLEKEGHIVKEPGFKGKSTVYTVLMVVNPKTLGSEAGNTTASEAGNTKVVRPASPEPSIEPPIEPPVNPQCAELSAGQKFFLQSFNAKRFKNNVQKDIVLDLESKYPKVFRAGVIWAATKGFTLGDAITKLETALPKWDTPKTNGNGNGHHPPPKQPELSAEEILAQLEALP